MPKNMENIEAVASLPPRRNISEIKNKLRRAEAYKQMKREQKKVIIISQYKPRVGRTATE